METLQRTANRGSISTGYDIDNSIKLETDNSEYLSRNPSTDTNRQTFTFSTWVKRAELGLNSMFIDVYASVGNWTVFGFDTSDRLVVYAIDGGLDNGYHYTPRFRDTSAWYHIVWKSDITNATAANRWQIYVNGVEVTAKDIDYGTPLTNFFTLINTTISTKIGYNSDSSNSASQYMAETHLIDGIALDPTDFGEYDEDSGIWKPKAYTGSYGTNGFYLDFESSGSLGADSSGNGNNFTVNNLTSIDQTTDTPTNNFCTMNAIQNGDGSTSTLTEGNLVVGTADNKGVASTFGVNKGKWYWEIKFVGSTVSQFVGVSNRENEQSGDASPTISSASIRSVFGAELFKNYTSASISSNSSFVNTNGAIYGVALDLDNGTLGRYVNGSLINTDTTLPSDNSVTFFPMSITTNSGLGGWNEAQFNFGNPPYTIASGNSDANGYGNFEYAPPTGYYALCTKNLAEYG
jgi:hypothetical protein